MPLFELHLPATLFVQVEAPDGDAARAMGTAIQQACGWEDRPFTDKGLRDALAGAEGATCDSWMLTPADSIQADFDVVDVPTPFLTTP